ncbi:OLC1v1018312C1 [Oldenlandia corymbosa var. corymbosa]|uniref:OLC1v1018312C1 n=1 Tax=Oldenlandia corymbosa var. corymbosa TaxID=529605 RepID=A0AAV1EBA9_OLDCO|nr:OLC1v1018312C1 [Oldenlandia corymbosa var. corymbosa]
MALAPFKKKSHKNNPVQGNQSPRSYPAPLASHEEVVANPSVFWDTLRIFHKTLGTKYMVPVIGGKELNLHVLYAEVTKRGGFDKVVEQKKWREVSGVFEFGPTTTSASYALRKHYFNLLHHYEMVYFFRLKSSMVLNSPGPMCFQAVGTIEAKFDCGYLVSVKLGSETLSGVLYHPVPEGSSSSSLTPKPSLNIVPYAAAVPEPRTALHSGRRRRKRRGDPGRPKPNRSGYNFFFAEKHSMLKTLYPNREREFTKMIGQSWNNLTPEERIVYQNYGVQDKERYQRELKEYKERMSVMSPS